MKHLQDMYCQYLEFQDLLQKSPQQVTKEKYLNMEYLKMNLQKRLTSLEPLKRNIYA